MIRPPKVGDRVRFARNDYTKRAYIDDKVRDAQVGKILTVKRVELTYKEAIGHKGLPYGIFVFTNIDCSAISIQDLEPISKLKVALEEIDI